MPAIPMPTLTLVPIVTKFNKPAWDSWVKRRELFKIAAVRSGCCIKGYWNKFTTPRKFILAKDYKLRIPFLGVKLVVPKGFLFDGASIPFFLWPLMYPIGILCIAGLFHDYAYKYNKLLIEVVTNKQGVHSNKREIFMENAGRQAFDKLFRELAIYTNSLALLCWTAWLGLAIGGFISWRKHRRNDPVALFI